VASLVVGGLLAASGGALVRAAGRVFLEAAPRGVDPDELGAELAAVSGVVQVHDLHVWQIGTGEPAASAHVLVQPPHDCHEVSGRLRQLLLDRHGIEHVTLQTEHVPTPGAPAAGGDGAECTDAHGPVHVSPEQ
jgi:cobalt-zinc-cadmium efflux system protein